MQDLCSKDGHQDGSSENAHSNIVITMDALCTNPQLLLHLFLVDLAKMWFYLT